jgi:hypothetical protein
VPLSDVVTLIRESRDRPTLCNRSKANGPPALLPAPSSCSMPLLHIRAWFRDTSLQLSWPSCCLESAAVSLGVMKITLPRRCCCLATALTPREATKLSCHRRSSKLAVEQDDWAGNVARLSFYRLSSRTKSPPWQDPLLDANSRVYAEFRKRKLATMVVLEVCPFEGDALLLHFVVSQMGCESKMRYRVSTLRTAGMLCGTPAVSSFDVFEL